MLESLRQIPGSDVSKTTTFEASTSGLNATMINARPALCFVDGQHTDEAVSADTRFCLSVLADNGIIMFHDANVIYGGLRKILPELTASGRVFRAEVIPGSIFLIEFGSLGLCDMEPLQGRVRENYKAYLFGMGENDVYRRAYHFSVARVAKTATDLYQAFVRPPLRKLKHLIFNSKPSKA